MDTEITDVDPNIDSGEDHPLIAPNGDKSASEEKRTFFHEFAEWYKGSWVLLYVEGIIMAFIMEAIVLGLCIDTMDNAWVIGMKVALVYALLSVFLVLFTWGWSRSTFCHVLVLISSGFLAILVSSLLGYTAQTWWRLSFEAEVAVSSLESFDDPANLEGYNRFYFSSDTFVQDQLAVMSHSGYCAAPLLTMSNEVSEQVYWWAVEKYCCVLRVDQNIDSSHCQTWKNVAHSDFVSILIPESHTDYLELEEAVSKYSQMMNFETAPSAQFIQIESTFVFTSLQYTRLANIILWCCMAAFGYPLLGFFGVYCIKSHPN